MKYLKSYKIFESLSDDMRVEIMDLFLPIRDKGFNVVYLNNIFIETNSEFGGNSEDNLFTIANIREDLEFAFRYIRNILGIKNIDIKTSEYHADQDDYDYDDNYDGFTDEIYNDLELIRDNCVMEQLEIIIR